MIKSTSALLIWPTAGSILILVSGILLASENEVGQSAEAQSAPQIQAATSLVELTTFLQSSNAQVRGVALRQWESLPINLTELDGVRMLVSNSDRAVKRYALGLASDIEFLQRQAAYRNIVLGDMEAADGVTNLYRYLIGSDEALRRFALMRWKRMPPRDGDKAELEDLMTNADWRVSQMAVIKFSQAARATNDIRRLGEIALRTSVPAPIKVEIIQNLGRLRDTVSDQCIRMILENSLRQKPAGDIKYAYRHPDYYDVSKAAIDALAQSQSAAAKEVLAAVARDESIYSGLREQAVKAMGGGSR